jgi:hypothetical protein
MQLRGLPSILSVVYPTQQSKHQQRSKREKQAGADGSDNGKSQPG